MTDDFELRLRRALRPVDPPDGFADRLLSRLPERERPVLVPPPLKAPGPRRARDFGMPAALAASLLVAVLLGQHLASDRLDEQEARARAASLEIMQALRVTSQKLDLAYEAVNQPPPLSDPRPADEENRS